MADQVPSADAPHEGQDRQDRKSASPAPRVVERGLGSVYPSSREGGGRLGKSDCVLIEKAMDRDWYMTPEERREVIEAALDTVRAGPTHRDRMAGARVLIAADAQNARRERTASLAEHHDRQDTTAALRAILATPEGRATLAELSCRLAGEQAASGQDASVPHVTGQEATRGLDPPSENLQFSNPGVLPSASQPPSDALSQATAALEPGSPGLPNAPASPQGDASLPVDASLSCVTPGEPPPATVDDDGTTQWASWPPPGDELQRGVRRRRRG